MSNFMSNTFNKIVHTYSVQVVLKYLYGVWSQNPFSNYLSFMCGKSLLSVLSQFPLPW